MSFRLFKNWRKSRRTQAAPNPNVQDTINRLSIPPLSQDSHQDEQHNHEGPANAQGQIQVDIMARPSSFSPPEWNPTTSLKQDQAKVDVEGAGPSFSTPVNSTASFVEHVRNDTGQVDSQDQTRHQPLHHVDLIPSSPCVGQDETFQKVCTFLKDGHNGIIGIYGMGGVGKTTLLEKVHNKFLVTRKFEVIIWIVVSKEVDERRIQKKIMDKLDLQYAEDETQNEQAIRIYNKLRRMKFVLIVDDIWEPLEMKNLGIPDPTDGKESKIIFTTRLGEVCDQMHPHQQVKVDCLGWNDAWILFEQNVGKKTVDSHPRIRGLAEQAVNECRGLPLALKVIGRAMTSKRNPQEWENAINTLRKSPSEISGTQKKLFFSLKLSYDALPNPNIKVCFLYCCLFPEDWSINKEKLIDYWIAEGFLGMDENLLEARNRGREYVSTLAKSFLLEDDREHKESVKMHDIIRDMAIWIVSEHGKEKSKFFVHPTPGLSRLQTIDRWREAQRIFVLNSRELPQITNKCRTLTLIWNSSVEVKSLDGLLNSMPLLAILELYFLEELPSAMEKLVELRYLCIKILRTSPSWLGNLTKLEILDLSKAEIEELPDTIGQLVELRHLNLAYFRHLKALPAGLGNCCKLEMLNLQGSILLEKLPNTLGDLGELRYLNLMESSIKMLPDEFWELQNLEHLYFIGNDSMRFTGVELSKLADFQSLNHLEICVTELSNLSRLSNSLTSIWMLDCCLSTLENYVNEASMDLLQLLVDMDKLSEMHIVRSPIKKIVASTVSNNSRYNTNFSSLEKLHVIGCANLSEIVLDKHSLVNLRQLEISECNRLKHVTGLQHLQQLEELYIAKCGNIEEVMNRNEEGTGGNLMKSICTDNTVSFPSLELLNLWMDGNTSMMETFMTCISVDTSSLSRPASTGTNSAPVPDPASSGNTPLTTSTFATTAAHQPSSSSSSFNLQQRLQAVIESACESWNYAIFWQASEDYSGSSLLGWGDGYYKGEEDKRGGNRQAMTAALLAHLEHRKKVLRELNALISGSQDGSYDNVDEVTDTEWFFLLSMTQCFVVVGGTGLPGQAFFATAPIWVTGANRLAACSCMRANMAQSLGIQTMVYIPLANGVVELGSTKLIFQSSDLIMDKVKLHFKF